jgi:hypothetical protein
MPARIQKSTRKPIRSAPTGLFVRHTHASRETSRDSERGISFKKSCSSEPKHRQWLLPSLASFITVCTLGLFLVSLVASNSLATQGGSNGDINSAIANLRNQNANLQTQAASLTSVSRIYKEALARGYVQPDKVMYATPPSPVALKP